MLLDLPQHGDGNKLFLLVSEGSENLEYFSLAWLSTLRKPVSILLFAYPHSCTSNFSSSLGDIEIRDYFSANCPVNVLEDIERFAKQHPNSVLLINCLNTLALQVGTSRACRFIEKLRQNHKSHIFCIYRRQFCKAIPRVETLADVCVSLLRKSTRTAAANDVHYQVNIVHRKPGGTVAHSRQLLCQDIENYKLTEISDSFKHHVQAPEKVQAQVQPQASFRIEMNEHEMKQRDSVPLPYVLSSSSGPKINYVYDDADDMDEEDPDDDLDI